MLGEKIRQTTFSFFFFLFFFSKTIGFGVWEGLRLVIVALHGLFSYHFDISCILSPKDEMSMSIFSEK